MYVFTLVLSVFCLWLPGAFAQEPTAPAPLGFQEWRDQQVLDAQNQLLRAQTRLTQSRAGKSAVPVKKAPRLPNDKVRETSEDDVTVAERDLKRAQDYLNSASHLTFANYIDVYLPSLKDNPGALQKLAEKLTKDELAQIFKALMNAERDADARHNQAILQKLALGTRR